MLPDSTLIASEQTGAASSMDDSMAEVSQPVLGESWNEDELGRADLEDDDFGVECNTCVSGLPKDKFKCSVK